MSEYNFSHLSVSEFFNSTLDSAIESIEDELSTLILQMNESMKDSEMHSVNNIVKTLSHVRDSLDKASQNVSEISECIEKIYTEIERLWVLV